MTARKIRFQAAPQRRRMVWTRSIKAETAATSGAFDLLEDFRLTTQYGAQPLGTTITRVRGTLVLGPSSVPSLEGITWGLVVEDRAELPGDVPRPGDERHLDWMAWQPAPHAGPSGLAGTTSSTEIDVRSQRKLDEVGQTLWFSWGQRSATVTWSLTIFFSVLLKLP